MRTFIFICIAAGLMFTCCSKEDENKPETGTVTDTDGNSYKTVKIGDQWWMTENLKVTHYGNGDPIPEVTDNTQWSVLDTGAYCNYGNDAGRVSNYGRLYNWYVINDNRNIAPEGWHVATYDDWTFLIDFLAVKSLLLMNWINTNSMCIPADIVSMRMEVTRVLTIGQVGGQARHTTQAMPGRFPSARAVPG